MRGVLRRILRSPFLRWTKVPYNVLKVVHSDWRRKRERFRSLRLLEERSLLPPRPATVAVIGCGRRGKGHVQNLLVLPSVKLEAIVDASESRLAWARKNVPGVRTYRNTSEMLAEVGSGLDLVVVATTTDVRVPIARALIEFGVPSMILEKPVATSVLDARELARLCQAKGVRATVNHNRRWSFDYAEIRSLIASGALGQLEQIRVTGRGEGLAVIGVHFSDLICYLAEAGPHQALGYVEREREINYRGAQFHDPSGYGMLTMDNGVIATIDFYSGNPFVPAKVHIQCEHATVEVNEPANEWTVTHWGGISQRSVHPFRTESIADECFMRAVSEAIEGKPSRCTLEDATTALEIIVALHISHARRAPVNLPLADADAARRFAFP